MYNKFNVKIRTIMTKIEINFGELNNFTIGVYVAEGEDEKGVFSMLVIGIGLIEMSVFKYN